MYFNIMGNYIEYLIFIVPAFMLSLLSYLFIKTILHKTSKIKVKCELTGSDTAHLVLDYNNIGKVSVVPINGRYNDNYDPASATINLSASVYYNSVVSAVSVAAHEAGHAVQYKLGYGFSHIIAVLAPTTQIGIAFSLPLAVAGFVFKMNFLVNIAILMFCLLLLLSLFTIPIELNASLNGIKVIKKADILTPKEFKYTKKMLYAVSLTYVAATFTSFFSIFRILVLFGDKDNRK